MTANWRSASKKKGYGGSVIDLNDKPVFRELDSNGLSYTYEGRIGSYTDLNGEIEIILFFDENVPLTFGNVHKQASSNGTLTRWQGYLRDWLNGGGDIFDASHHLKLSGTMTNNALWGSVDLLELMDTDFDSRRFKAEDAVIKFTERPKCNCGAVYFGAKDYGPGHNSECPRFKR